MDLKFHDIPNTIEGAIQSALLTNPFMMTVHISGGKSMLERSVMTVQENCEKESIKKPLIVGVSVLTSIDEKDFYSLGLSGRMEDQVKRLADLALDAGLDGIVCSLNHIHVFDDESFSELQDRAKEMIDDLSRNAFKKYFKGLINLRRKSFQEE